MNKKKNKKCMYPDWEGGYWAGKHSFNTDGFCTTCGDVESDDVIKRYAEPSAKTETEPTQRPENETTK